MAAGFYTGALEAMERRLVEARRQARVTGNQERVARLEAQVARLQALVSQNEVRHD